MRKKLIIVEHVAKEYANRRWSDMSVHAYGLEIGAKVINHTRLEHTNKFGHLLHFLYARIVDRFTRRSSGLWALGAPKFLPPSGELSERYLKAERVYFFGWLFRNPIGFEKYRAELLKAFTPPRSIQKNSTEILSTLPSGPTRIGVQIKQKPFRGFPDGEFLVSPSRVQTILEEYLREKHLSTKDVALVVATDKSLPEGVFGEFRKVVSTTNAETHLFLLSTCSAILGTNSTLPNLAAWFGNIPHIVTKDAPIDWAYYKNKEMYFENKYANFAL